MKNSNSRPILVTGSHRSGSTWAGKMLSLSSMIGYINEPFNMIHRPGICKAKFDYWFPYICAKNEQNYINDIRNCINFKYNGAEELKISRSIRDLGRLARDYYRFAKYRRQHRRPLIKDPIAVFSASWLADRFDMDVVILIRHPAAFAGSIKSMNMRHPFDHFLRQNLLMEHYLNKYRPEIEDFTKSEKDAIDQSILLWNLIHHMILMYRQDHPEWFFVKHETLSRNPVEEFGKLYDKLGINFTDQLKRKIMQFTNAVPAQNNPKSLERDSKSNISTWQKRLTKDEIARVKAGTVDIAREFYGDGDWI